MTAFVQQWAMSVRNVVVAWQLTFALPRAELPPPPRYASLVLLAHAHDGAVAPTFIAWDEFNEADENVSGRVTAMDNMGRLNFVPVGTDRGNVVDFSEAVRAGRLRFIVRNTTTYMVRAEPARRDRIPEGPATIYKFWVGVLKRPDACHCCGNRIGSDVEYTADIPDRCTAEVLRLCGCAEWAAVRAALDIHIRIAGDRLCGLCEIMFNPDP